MFGRIKSDSLRAKAVQAAAAQAYRNLFLSGEGTSHIYLFIFIHFTFVYMLNAICITTNQLEHIQTNLCIHLSYLEDQRNLKIYNKNI